MIWGLKIPNQSCLWEITFTQHSRSQNTKISRPLSLLQWSKVPNLCEISWSKPLRALPCWDYLSTVGHHRWSPPSAPNPPPPWTSHHSTPLLSLIFLSRVFSLSFILLILLRRRLRHLCLPPGTLHLISAYKTENPEPFIDDSVARHGSQKTDLVWWFSSSIVCLHGSYCQFYILTELNGLTGLFLNLVNNSIGSPNRSGPSFKTLPMK